MYHKRKRNKSRIEALMLKVTDDETLDDAQETESAVILSEELPPIEKTGKECESLIWGNKKNSNFVTCSFRKRVIEIAENLKIGKDKIEGANWLMAVMALETDKTFDPSIGTFLKKGHGDEDKGGYVGLIQFGYWAALDIKIKRSKLAKMTALKQLDCVENYFKLPQFKGKLKTLTDLYLAVLYQGACGHVNEKNYVVFDSESSNSTNKKAYWDNPTFHNEADEIKKNSKGTIYERNGKKKGKTYVWEVKLAIHGWYSKGTAKKNTCKKDASTCDFGTSVGKYKDILENDFGLVQVTKLGNPYIINSGTEDKYSYTKKDGTKSEAAKHGDDWMLPEKAKAFSNAVYKIVKEYPNQKIYLGDCSAYNPAKNLGHSSTGAHSNGNAFDCQFLKSNGSGSNSIYNLTEDEIKLNGRFIELLKETGHFSTFYTDNGKIPGSVHEDDHDNHIHGN